MMYLIGQRVRSVQNAYLGLSEGEEGFVVAVKDVPVLGQVVMVDWGKEVSTVTIIEGEQSFGETCLPMLTEEIELAEPDTEPGVGSPEVSNG